MGAANSCLKCNFPWFKWRKGNIFRRNQCERQQLDSIIKLRHDGSIVIEKFSNPDLEDSYTNDTWDRATGRLELGVKQVTPRVDAKESIELRPLSSRSEHMRCPFFEQDLQESSFGEHASSLPIPPPVPPRRAIRSCLTAVHSGDMTKGSGGIFNVPYSSEQGQTGEISTELNFSNLTSNEHWPFSNSSDIWTPPSHSPKTFEEMSKRARNAVSLQDLNVNKSENDELSNHHPRY